MRWEVNRIEIATKDPDWWARRVLTLLPRPRRTWRTQLHRWGWALVIGAVSGAVGSALVLGVWRWA